MRHSILIVFIAFTCVTAVGAQESPDRETPQETPPTKTVDAGFVFIDWEYVAAPYVISRNEAGELTINGQVVQEAASAPGGGFFAPRRGFGYGQAPAPRWQGNFGRPGGPGQAPDSGPPPRWNRPRSVFEMQNLLECGEMIFCFEGKIESVNDTDALLVIRELLSDHPEAEQTEAIMLSVSNHISDEQIALLMERFEPTEELIARTEAPLLELEQAIAKNMADHRWALFRERFQTPMFQYGATLTVLVLAVFSLGNLLHARPEYDGSWRDVNSAAESTGMVLRNAVLLAILGLLDLACTVVAEQSGGFLEMNPLGAAMMDSPILLSLFKGLTLLGSCGLLVSLRRYRGAQVASWWLCLVCTVLMFRWLTYGSMFMG